MQAIRKASATSLSGWRTGVDAQTFGESTIWPEIPFVFQQPAKVVFQSVYSDVFKKLSCSGFAPGLVSNSRCTRVLSSDESAAV